MYGMVNEAARELIVTRFGLAVWRKIREDAGISEDRFVTMETYDDATTFGIVAAAARVLEVSQESVLLSFGEFWILFAQEHGYGELMRASGKDLFEFLSNLDGLHTRLALAFPDFQPPSFRCVSLTKHQVEVHYHSVRQGLAPFVVGLLRGLGAFFSVDLEIEHVKKKAMNVEHDVFLVTVVPRV